MFANYPDVFGSDFSYQVPAGYNGRILTCNVFGSPPPTVEWLTPSSSSGSISHTTQSTIYFSTFLEIKGGFLQSDSGMYYCSVRLKSQRSQSEAITLEYTTNNMPVTEPTSPSSCEVMSATVSFELRVLTTDCQSWSEGTRQQISTEMEDTCAGGILSQCQNCSINMIIERIDCSYVKEGATIFRAIISNTEIDVTQDAFCAFLSWWEFQPLIRINGEFRPSDPSCKIQVHSSSGGECSEGATGTPVLLIGASSAGAILMGLVCLCINIAIIRSRRRRYLLLNS